MKKTLDTKNTIDIQTESVNSESIYKERRQAERNITSGKKPKKAMRIIFAGIAAAIVIGMTGNHAQAATTAAGSAGTLEIDGEALIGTPNPFQDFTTLGPAQDYAGFQLKLPLVVPEGYSNPVYRAIQGDFLEVVWRNANGADFRYRKCPASDGDASGDYNDYPVNRTIRIGNVDLRLRADENNKVYVISGTASDGYSYAMTCSAGLTTDELARIRQGFINEWLPVALQGETAETAQNLMDTFSTRLYDTGISLMYKDDQNPSYFFYISLDENRKVTNVAYLEDGLVQLDEADGSGDSSAVSGTSPDQARQSLEQSMTGNFVDRVRQNR